MRAFLALVTSVMLLLAVGLGLQNIRIQEMEEKLATRPVDTERTIVERVVEKKIIRFIEKAGIGTEDKFHLLRSTVRVSNGNGSGTGVIIYSGKAIETDKKFYSYAITCSHVVDGLKKVTVEKFAYIDNRMIASTTSCEGNVIADDPLTDVALVEILSDAIFPDVAALVSPDDFKEMALGDPVYACGCALGCEPFITEGSVSSFKGLQGHIQITAPITFGNSGGGVFTKSGKLLGLARMILGSPAGPYPHGGLIVPVWVIDRWLGANGLGFSQGAQDGSSIAKLLELRAKAEEAEKRKAFQKMVDEFMKALKAQPAPEVPLPDDFFHEFK